MKKFLLLALLFICFKMNAQTPTFEWATMTGNNQNLYVYDNATDSAGNVYLTGEYSGTVDFDPGTGTQMQTATSTGGRDIFVLKLDSTGVFGWVKTYGGTGVDFGQRITVDNTGNVFVGGRFQNSVNFAGYGGFASNGDYDGFLLKIDATGILQWVIDLSGGGAEGFTGLETDNSGNVYTTGFFRTATATLGGLNSTSATLILAGAGINYDFFVAKYNTNGEIIWSNSTGAGYDELSYNIALTDDNKVVTVGTFIGTSVDFNPGVAINSIFSNSNSTTTGFIQVLDASNGTFSWARSLGSTSNDAVYGVATVNNNIYVTGFFSGTQGDFNTTGSGGGDVISRIGAIDTFIAKYTSNSTFVWVKQIRGTTGSDVRGTSIAVKGTPEKVYASGTFTSQVFLNPASSTTYVSAFGGRDAFVVSLDDAGLYQWGGSVRSMDNEDAWGLSIDNNYNVYMTGYSASGNIALNPFANNTVPNNSTTGNDVFVVKLAQPNACIVNIPNTNFKNYLINNAAINTNADSEIQCNEATAFTGTINCSNLNITDLTGVEAFTNSTSIYCTGNQLSNINLNSNTALQTLHCDLNQLTSLDVSNNANLIILVCSDNLLTSLDVSSNSSLQVLRCESNLLTNLNVSSLTNLGELRCYLNQLTSLNLSTNDNLFHIWCFDNQISNLTLPNNNTIVQSIYCNNNQIATLDVSNYSSLSVLNCSNNLLTELNLANTNNINITSVDCTNNSSLSCIQIDNGFTPPSNGTWIKDATSNYNVNCNLSSVAFTIENSFFVYPNPVKDLLTIQGEDELIDVAMYNYAGQEIKVFLIHNTINLSGLSSGVYVLKVKTSSDLEIVRKIVKE